jgi:hypothetical protein
MHKCRWILLAVLLLLGANGAWCDPLPTFFEGIFNEDGTLHDSLFSTWPGDLPANYDLSGYDLTTGLGEIAVVVRGTGSHSLLAFIDLELGVTGDPANPFSPLNDELGYAVNTGLLPAGLSWQIGDPLDPDLSAEPPAVVPTSGYLYENFAWNALSNEVQSGDIPDDIAIALGWNFILAPGEKATILFRVAMTAPTSGFYLQQTQPAGSIGELNWPEHSAYFSTSVAIEREDIVIPEPGTGLLLLAGLGLLAASRARQRTA